MALISSVAQLRQLLYTYVFSFQRGESKRAVVERERERERKMEDSGERVWRGECVGK